MDTTPIYCLGIHTSLPANDKHQEDANGEAGTQRASILLQMFHFLR